MNTARRGAAEEPRLGSGAGEGARPLPGGGGAGRKDPATRRLIFSFSKHDRAVFYPHLTMIDIFCMAFVRAGIPVAYSAGFNPLPRLEIASPLAMGIAAEREIAGIEVLEPLEGEEFVRLMNPRLPPDVRITGAMSVCVPSGAKKWSLSALLWGGLYALPAEAPVAVPFAEEKKFREEAQTRLAVLAKDPASPDRPAGYFEVFKRLYP